MFRDPDFLRSVSLGRFGSMIEATIHDAMHMRWSAKPSGGIRPDTSGDGSTGGVIRIDPKWDDPMYDFLADGYAAHVNPIFWRIHGWVDDRISDWMIANGIRIGFHTSRVEPHWLGTWHGVLPTGPALASFACAHDHHDGGDGHEHAHDHGHHHGDPHYTQKLEHAVSVVQKSGVIHHIYARTQCR
ncbi:MULTISPECIES: hypothetical protein [Bradyrhizobium]|uniref:hypothetical protein n=1 Tax=Bradyrhizobium TaxID=374 RepID=UPI00155E80C0|nr:MULTISPECIES: hypothetical protein [Bradyrhizobium]MDD1567977.1 hypothetical protein [Bradyrhizobium sp. WBAH33]QCK00480.1 hypothetical protein DAA61_34925 [Bradyrhizobium sp. WBAH33]QCK07849.1 hypothetical protein DAB18_34970 [Bradyrhizobium sp. WBAH41]UUO31793.1 hypothetical protein DCG74_33600 [Bradyrhizobium sp. WBAH42]